MRQLSLAPLMGGEGLYLFIICICLLFIHLFILLVSSGQHPSQHTWWEARTFICLLFVFICYLFIYLFCLSAQVSTPHSTPGGRQGLFWLVSSAQHPHSTPVAGEDFFLLVFPGTCTQCIIIALYNDVKSRNCLNIVRGVNVNKVFPHQKNIDLKMFSSICYYLN